MRAHIWTVAIPLFMAGAGWWFVPPALFSMVSSELMVFFSIQAASVLPAMIFTASFPSATYSSLDYTKKLHGALQEQMRFWRTLLILTLLAVGSLIITKVFNDHRVFTGLAVGIGTCATIQFFKLPNALASLLKVKTDAVEKTIEAHNAKTAEALRASFVPSPTPDGYGERVFGPSIPH